MSLHVHWSRKLSPAETIPWNSLSRTLMNGGEITSSMVDPLLRIAEQQGKRDRDEGEEEPAESEFSELLEQSRTVLLRCRQTDSNDLTPAQRASIHTAIDAVYARYETVVIG